MKMEMRVRMRMRMKMKMRTSDDDTRFVRKIYNFTIWFHHVSFPESGTLRAGAEAGFSLKSPSESSS